MGHDAINSLGRDADQTPIDPLSICSLVASRICHDLISPMGAISNGLELLGMSKGRSGAEFDLITQSIHAANTRLRLYRIAFGTVSTDQRMSQAEILSVLADLGQTQKHSYVWNCQTDVTRKQVKLIFLLIMCLETALPWGGRIEIQDAANGFALRGLSDRLKVDDTLWHGLASGGFATAMTSARVQFVLAQEEITSQFAKLTVEEDGSRITLTVTL